MALAATVIMVEHRLRKKTLTIAVQASGNYAAGGDTLDLTKLLNPSRFADAVVGYPGNIQDFEVENLNAGYSGQLVKGGTLATWKLKVLQGGAAVSNPQAELPAAAYPAALLTVGNVFTIVLTGPKLQM